MNNKAERISIRVKDKITGEEKEILVSKTELLEKYSSNLTGSKNRNHYLSYARDFLDHADGLNKESVTKYIEGLKRHKRSSGTRNFVFRVIRRLFVVNAIEWPFLRGQAPQIDQRDEYKPALDPELIKIMIEAAKSGKLASDECAFLALSTVYGLRRAEMVNLEPKDFAGDTVFIATVKMGRERYHLIPLEIKKYLAAHDFSQRYSLTGMDQVFWRIVNNSGLGQLKEHRLGWHAIRRTCLSVLHKAGLDPFSCHQFLRWKGGAEGGLAMDARYHATSFIGLEGTKVVTLEAEGDREIFEKHPLLAMWKD